MYLKAGTFSEMAANIKKNKSRIALFGAGVIGTSTASAILNAYGLTDYAVCYIDNDTAKQNMTINIDRKAIRICTPDVLYTLGQNTVILMNASRYADILNQLEQMECTKNMTCYMIPMMCISNFHSEGGQGVIKTSTAPVIPRKIHYMWLGGGEIPEKIQYCIDSWKKYCPDYKIIRWDETNYDVEKCLYMKQAYQHKKYGYVPDYARIDILYHHGGIYMDTDVELLRNLDRFLYQEAFTSVEKWQVVNFGGCSGAMAGHPSLKPFLQVWEQRKFIREDGSEDILSSGYVDTRVALDHGYVLNGKNQSILGMNIYTYDYFHPYDYMSGKTEMTDDTYAIHHFNGGWLDQHAQNVRRQTQVQFNSLYQRIQSGSDYYDNVTVI